MTLLVHQGPSPTPLEQKALAFQQSTASESDLKDVSDATRGQLVLLLCQLLLWKG